MAISGRVVPVGEVELVVLEAGAGGRPLLLIHGFTGAADDFADFLLPLAEAGWHVVAPDLRGHGASSKPTAEADYSIEVFAADVLSLADAVGFETFVLLGHSMGGMIVEQVVLGAPERIEALVLMDTASGPLRVDPELVALGAAVARTDGIDVVADIMGAADDGPLATEAYRRKVAEDPSYAARGDRNLRASSPAMFAALLTEIPQRPDTLADLAGLTMPTLVIVGEEDEPFLADSRAMADAIPGAQLAVIPGGGHSPQFEAPTAWWAALSGFLATVAAASADPAAVAG